MQRLSSDSDFLDSLMPRKEIHRRGCDSAATRVDDQVIYFHVLLGDQMFVVLVALEVRQFRCLSATYHPR